MWFAFSAFQQWKSNTTRWIVGSVGVRFGIFQIKSDSFCFRYLRSLPFAFISIAFIRFALVGQIARRIFCFLLLFFLIKTKRKTVLLNKISRESTSALGKRNQPGEFSIQNNTTRTTITTMNNINRWTYRGAMQIENQRITILDSCFCCRIGLALFSAGSSSFWMLDSVTSFMFV